MSETPTERGDRLLRTGERFLACARDALDRGDRRTAYLYARGASAYLATDDELFLENRSPRDEDVARLRAALEGPSPKAGPYR